MPIAFDGKVYEDQYALETGRPVEAQDASVTKDGTQVPSSENNAPASSAGAPRGILQDLLPVVLNTGFADFSEEGKRYIILPYEGWRKSDNIEDRREEPEEQGPIHPNDPQGGWYVKDNLESLNEQSILSAQLGGNDLDIASVQDWNDSRFPNYKTVKEDKRLALAEENKRLEEEFNKPQDISDDQIARLMKRLSDPNKPEAYKRLEELEQEYLNSKNKK